MKIKSIFILALMVVSTSVLAQQKGNPLDVLIRKLIYSQSAISQLYVDTVNFEKMTEDAIRGMLKELDPHSTYTPAKDVQSLNEPLNGSFEGIGVQFNMNRIDLEICPAVRSKIVAAGTEKTDEGRLRGLTLGEMVVGERNADLLHDAYEIIHDEASSRSRLPVLQYRPARQARYAPWQQPGRRCAWRAHVPADGPAYTVLGNTP